MLSTAFRKYDIRGRVGSELHLNEIYNLACSLAYLLQTPLYHCNRVVVGMDGRTHSPTIKNELIKGLADAGLDVVFIGCVPSPVCYFAHQELNTDASIMITASHNNKEYNGLKISVGDSTFFDHDITVLRLLYENRTCSKLPKRQGAVEEINIIPRYIDRLYSEFSSLHNCALPVVFDCSNAPAGIVMQEIIRRFNFTRAQLLFADINGEFPNHEPDPTKIKNIAQLKDVVMAQRAIGIAFDGDADRMAAVTESGKHLVGDDISALFCYELLQKNGPFTAILEIKCAMTLISWLRSQGITIHQTPCGHSFVVNAMSKYKALFGGELSCHYCFSDRYYGFDDGIYAALRLLEIASETNKKLDELAATLPERYLSAEMRIPCAENYKDTVVSAMITYARTNSNRYEIITLDGLCVVGSDCAATIRKSNTESVLSVRFEGATPASLSSIACEFYQQLSLQPLNQDQLKPFFEQYL